jgi:hypothetical protein
VHGKGTNFPTDAWVKNCPLGIFYPIIGKPFVQKTDQNIAETTPNWGRIKSLKTSEITKIRWFPRSSSDWRSWRVVKANERI